MLVQSVGIRRCLVLRSLLVLRDRLRRLSPLLVVLLWILSSGRRLLVVLLLLLLLWWVVKFRLGWGANRRINRRPTLTLHGRAGKSGRSLIQGQRRKWLLLLVTVAGGFVGRRGSLVGLGSTLVVRGRLLLGCCSVITLIGNLVLRLLLF